MAYEKKFNTTDTGSLHASKTKTKEIQPDYWGDIRVNLKDMTGITIEDGCHVIKVSGWKKMGPSGQTFLSLRVNRYVPESASPEPQRQQFADDSDIPF